jgi:menaquinone-dependent protoporphyrinogen oxidase
MSDSVLVLHGSRFGQSTKIANAVAARLNEAGWQTDVRPLTKDSAPDPEKHSAFVLATSIRYGHFDTNSNVFLANHLAWVNSVPSMFVSVSLTARKPEKRSVATHGYTRKFLAKTQWHPDVVEIVAGAIDYPKYRIWDKKAIQLIMTMSKGPTKGTEVIEYTDWDQVRDGADRFAALLSTRRHD